MASKKYDLEEAKSAIKNALEAAEDALDQIKIARSSQSPATILESLKDAKTAFATSKRAIAYALDAMPESVSERAKTDTAEKNGQKRIAGTGEEAN